MPASSFAFGLEMHGFMAPFVGLRGAGCASGAVPEAVAWLSFDNSVPQGGHNVCFFGPAIRYCLFWLFFLESVLLALELRIWECIDKGWVMSY